MRSGGARLREVIALAEGVRTVAREGSLHMTVSDTFLEHARDNGVRVREYAVRPGGSVQCTVGADDDLLIGRLTAELSAANRVDLSICDGRGVERLRMRDIPVHSGAGSVAFQYSITTAKAAPTETMIARLVTYDEVGAEQLIGEYTFHHTRSLPGPGAW